MVSPQDEATPIVPANPYGAAKAMGHAMVSMGRSLHGLYACNAILFNHVAYKRDNPSVVNKICRAAALCKLGRETKLHLGRLDVKRDWGCAKDFVKVFEICIFI